MYQIISDSSCDLPKELLEENNVMEVPFYVSVDGKTHQKEKVELQVKDFYQFMIDHPKVFPKTSMPSIQDYIDVFEPLIKEGKDIICICITTKFSGSYNSAIGAKQILEESYPMANMTIIDATVNTVLQGLLVLEAAKMQKHKATYEEVVNAIEEIKHTGRIFFTIGSMDYLVNGGRVGKLSGIAAGTLGIKPLIILKTGEIHKAGIVRNRNTGKKKLIKMLLQYIEEQGKSPEVFSITVGYGYDKEEGNTFKEEVVKAIQEVYPSYTDTISIYNIGATIAVHTGPHPIGIGIIKKI